MRIGTDLDGVHVDWNRAFAGELAQITGRSPQTEEDIVNPPVWEWPHYFGYTNKEENAVWRKVCASPHWWEELGALPGVEAWDNVVQALEDHHDVYYLTSRSGNRIKRQSEFWLRKHYGYDKEQRRPTVMIVKKDTRGDVVRALQLDAYIDDNLDNAIDVALKSPKTRVYLLNYRYNACNDTRDVAPNITRVNSVQEFIDKELVNIQKR